MKERYAGHHMRKLGYLDPKLDQAETRRVWASDGALMIRAREQQVIDDLDGATRDRSNPRLGNAINGLGTFNPIRLLIPMARGTYGPAPSR
jgi:hypothetical protein